MRPDEPNCACELNSNESSKGSNIECVSDSKNMQHDETQTVSPSSQVFHMGKYLYRKTYFYLFIGLVCLYSLIVPLVAYTVFDMAHPFVLSIMALLVSCMIFLPYLIGMRGLTKAVVIVSQEDIHVRYWMVHYHIRWKEVSHFVLHYFPMLLRLDIFDKRGKRFVTISGLFDCISIAETIKEIGIPERSKRSNQKKPGAYV